MIDEQTCLHTDKQTDAMARANARASPMRQRELFIQACERTQAHAHPTRCTVRSTASPEGKKKTHPLCQIRVVLWIRAWFSAIWMRRAISLFVSGRDLHCGGLSPGAWCYWRKGKASKGCRGRAVLKGGARASRLALIVSPLKCRHMIIFLLARSCDTRLPHLVLFARRSLSLSFPLHSPHLHPSEWREPATIE